jgi:hypothetical protein
MNSAVAAKSEDAQKPFRIFLSLLDKWEIGAPLSERIALSTLSVIESASVFEYSSLSQEDVSLFSHLRGLADRGLARLDCKCHLQCSGTHDNMAGSVLKHVDGRSAVRFQTSLLDLEYNRPNRRELCVSSLPIASRNGIIVGTGQLIHSIEISSSAECTRRAPWTVFICLSLCY